MPTYRVRVFTGSRCRELHVFAEDADAARAQVAKHGQPTAKRIHMQKIRTGLKRR
jgi:hypothetical protein